MADIVDEKTRSRMMANIRSGDTRPEFAVRRALHRRGFRYRLREKGLPGKPDIVLRKFNAVIFVHGCFWHQHPGCRFATKSATRPEFWQKKFAANVTRDHVARSVLLEMGWRVATVWECALGRKQDVEDAADQLEVWLRSSDVDTEIGEARLPRLRCEIS